MDQIDILTGTKNNETGFTSLSIGRRNSAIPFTSTFPQTGIIERQNSKSGIGSGNIFEDLDEKPDFYNPLERKSSARRSSEFRPAKVNDDLLDLLIESEKDKDRDKRPTTSNVRKPQSSEGRSQTNYANTFTAGFYKPEEKSGFASSKPPLFSNTFQLPESAVDKTKIRENLKPGNFSNTTKDPINDSEIQVLNLTKSRRKSMIRGNPTIIIDEEKRSNLDSIEHRSHKTDDLKSPGEIISNKLDRSINSPTKQIFEKPQILSIDPRLKQELESRIKILEQRLEAEKSSNKDLNSKKDQEFDLMLKREIERMNELHKAEFERIKSYHLSEIEELKRKHESDILSYKTQIESNSKISVLMDELKINSQKMLSAYESASGPNKFQESTVSKELHLQSLQKAIDEEKRRLEMEREILESERKRFNESKKLLENKENQLRNEIDNERKIVFKEINRLNELQESIRNMEAEKRKELIMESERIKGERQELEKERLYLNEEYECKYKELETQIIMVGGEKNQIEELNNRVSKKIKEKLSETEKIRIRMLEEENSILKKKRETELKEVEILQLYDEVNAKNTRLNMERDAFELEISKFNDLAKAVNSESSFIRQFKSNFETEKEALKRKWEDLELFKNENIRKENELDTEKRKINEMQRALENLRFNTVHELQRNQHPNLRILDSNSTFKKANSKLSIPNNFNIEDEKQKITTTPINNYSKSKSSIKSLISHNNHIKEIESDLDSYKYFFNKEQTS